MSWVFYLCCYGIHGKAVYVLELCVFFPCALIGGFMRTENIVNILLLN